MKKNRKFQSVVNKAAIASIRESLRTKKIAGVKIYRKEDELPDDKFFISIPTADIPEVKVDGDEVMVGPFDSANSAAMAAGTDDVCIVNAQGQPETPSVDADGDGEEGEDPEHAAAVLGGGDNMYGEELDISQVEPNAEYDVDQDGNLIKASGAGGDTDVREHKVIVGAKHGAAMESVNKILSGFAIKADVKNGMLESVICGVSGFRTIKSLAKIKDVTVKFVESTSHKFRMKGSDVIALRNEHMENLRKKVLRDINEAEQKLDITTDAGSAGQSTSSGAGNTDQRGVSGNTNATPADGTRTNEPTSAPADRRPTDNDKSERSPTAEDPDGGDLVLASNGGKLRESTGLEEAIKDPLAWFSIGTFVQVNEMSSGKQVASGVISKVTREHIEIGSSKYPYKDYRILKLAG